MEQTISEILESVKIKMENQGDYSREAYKGFIDEAIDDFMRRGVITDDDNMEMITDKLMLRYEEIIDGLSSSFPV